MKIILNTKFINKALKDISKISDTSILDFSLIYKKYCPFEIEISKIIAEISGSKKKLVLNLKDFLPFYIDILKRKRSYPVAYITKSKYFYESNFYVEKGVLIPRTDTEILVDICILFSIVAQYKKQTNFIKDLKDNSKIGEFDSIDSIDYIDYSNLIWQKDEQIYKFIKDKKNEKNKIHSTIRFLELCSGSSAISISIIKKLADLNIFTQSLNIDISRKAILIAKKNVEIILDKRNFQIEFLKLDILGKSFIQKIKKFLNLGKYDSIDEEKKFDFIVANPPYISKDDFKKLKVEVKKYEPKIALTPKDDQNLFYEKIIDIANFLLKKDGIVAVEVSDKEHAKKVANIFCENNYNVLIIKDIQNIARVVLGQRKDDIQFTRC